MPQKVYRLPYGFFTPVIAFEFAASTHDISGIFGNEMGTVSAPIVKAMDLGNTLDYLYMVQYSFFLGLFSLISYRLTGKKILFLSALLSLLALIGDIFENIQLFGISANALSGDYSSHLFMLHYWTWLKWGSLALAMFLIPLAIWEKRFLNNLLAILGLVTFILSVIALFYKPFICEFFGLSITLMFLLLIIYCFTYIKRTA